jgi:MerR family transcriptional regulator, thiopeptide resistance regulator
MSDNKTMTAPPPLLSTLTSISRVAARLGATPRALRHYEALGLVTPKRSEGQTRAYDSGAIQRLELIVALRAAGLPLFRVAEILDDRADESVRRGRAERLLEAALEQARRAVERLEAASRAARDEGLPGLRRLVPSGESVATR